MNVISDNDIAQAIFQILKDKSAQEQLTFLPKIAVFLHKKRLLSHTKDILAKLRKTMSQEDKILEVNLWSAFLLTEDKKKEIASFLKKRHKVEQIIFNENVEKKLLGGYRIEANNEIIDMTIDSQIKKLQEHLIS